MNFRPTTKKVLGSIIIGLILEYLAYSLGGNYGLFTGIPFEGTGLAGFWIRVIINSIIYSLITYIVWSLTSKK